MQSDSSFQNLKEYFRRPTWFGGGLLPVGTRERAFSWAFDNLGDHILLRWPMGLERLRGVYGFRFRMVFTLTVAATPFQQGVLALGWQYGIVDAPAADFDRGRLSSAVTNLPHVRLDLAGTTMVQLSVPFLFTGECLPVNSLANPNEKMPYGLLSLNTVLPVEAVPSASAPQFRLAVHLEDLELVGASPLETEGVLVQSGGLVEKEVRAVAHPYSSVGYALAGGLRWVARGVPALSSFAGTTAWMLEKASGVARAFGYSKPQILDPMHRVARFECVGEQNVDQPSATLVVGPMSSNRLAIDSAVGASDVDEMSLKYVLSRWSQVCVFPFKTENNRDDVLYVASCAPRAMWFREFSSVPAANFTVMTATPRVDANSFMPSHLFYVGTCFRQWRGGFRFRFTFAKTKFHAGRVMVNFNPYFLGVPLSGVTSALACATSQLTGYSTIFDLRDDSVFEFEVPYTASFPFLSIGSSFGTVSMRVVDALLAPEMVASQISVLVEVQAMDDFEFAVPAGPTYAPHVRGAVVPQAFAPAHAISERACEQSVGECITSIKQLIMIPHKKECSVFTSAQLPSGLTLPPFWYQPIPSTTLPTPVLTGTLPSLKPMSLGFPGYFSKCYTYVRGGQDVHVEMRAANADDSLDPGNAGPAGTRITATYWNDNNAFNPNSVGKGRSRFSTASMPCVYGTNHVHARYPAYMKGVRARTSSYDAVDWDGQPGLNNTVVPFSSIQVGNDADRGTPEVTPYVLFSNARADSGLTATRAVYSRSASDDAVLAHYIGPTPLWVAASTSDNSVYDPDNYTTGI